MAQVIKMELEAKGVGVYGGHAVESIEKTADGLQVNCRELKTYPLKESIQARPKVNPSVLPYEAQIMTK